MKLREALIESNNLGEHDVLYARRPWLLDSDALVVSYSEGQSVTRFLADDASFEYFLEVPLVQDIRHQVEAAGSSSEEALDVLLYYAENDAFPQ